MPRKKKETIEENDGGVAVAEAPVEEEAAVVTAVENIEAKEEEEVVEAKPVLPVRPKEIFDLSSLKEMSISQLTHIARDLGVPGASGMRKQELIFKVLAAQTEKKSPFDALAALKRGR